MLNYVLPVLLLLGLVTPVRTPAQALSPIGTWADDTGETHIEIYRCGEAICGQLVWLKPDPAPTARAANAPTTPPLATDLRNPDPAKRDRPLHNLVVLQNLRYNPDDNRWEDGEIYDPRNGRTYSCLLTMQTKDRLEVKGYIGFSLLSRSHPWTRVK